MNLRPERRGVVDVASLVLFAADPDLTADFYRVVGIELEHEDHGEGPVHYATELGGLHFAIYPGGHPARHRTDAPAAARSRASTWSHSTRSPAPWPRSALRS